MWDGGLRLIGVLVCIVSAVSEKIKPASSYFDICHTSDPNYNVCVKKSLIKLHPLMNKGIPDLKLQPFEPLKISRIEFVDGSGRFKLHQILTNLTVRGMSSIKIVNLNLRPTERIMEFALFNPKLDFDGDYIMDGQILVIPIQGNGTVTFSFTGVTTLHDLKLEEYLKHGKPYVRIKNYKLTIEPEGAQSYFTNLFNGNKYLSDSTNKFLNENWREAFYTYKEIPEKAFSEFFKTIGNQVLSLFPKDELFPI